MILTFKMRHGQDFSTQLAKARLVAEYAIANRSQLSTKYVKHLGLSSMISCQILWKYGRNRRCKRVHNVNLIVSGQAVKVDTEAKTIYIPCLKLTVNYRFTREFTKVNQVEFTKDWIFVYVTVAEKPLTATTSWVGVDLNTTGHCAVVANPSTGKLVKMGKQAQHIHRKYKTLRRKFAKRGSFTKLKATKQRQSNKVRDLNHKISKRIVQFAEENKCGIKLEKLTGIRDNAKHVRSFNYQLNNWSFYQLQQMITYKARLQGVAVAYVAPYMTSQTCSKCGLKGERTSKRFVCPIHGLENADVNAAFNIGLRPSLVKSVSHLAQERDCVNGSNDTPEAAMATKAANRKIT